MINICFCSLIPKYKRQPSYALEQRWEILRHYFENHCNIAECVRNAMFCGLFLIIALSAAELMSFGHLGAAL